jgi:hypothetical protein
MRETRSSGSVRGAFSNERPYRERNLAAGVQLVKVRSVARSCSCRFQEFRTSSRNVGI